MHINANKLLAFLFIIILLINIKDGCYNLSRNKDNVDAVFMRKTSQYLFGNENVVGGRIDLWYTSGAKHYLNLHDFLLLDTSNTKNTDKDWIKNFDYLVEHGHMSNNTTNKNQTTISGLYLANTVKLQGYNYYADPIYHTNTIYYSLNNDTFKSLILLKDSCLIGIYDSSNPDAHFVSFVITKDEIENIQGYNLDYYTPVSLVDTTGTPYQMGEDIKEYIVYGFIGQNNIENWIAKNEGKILQIKDTIPISWSKVPKSEIENIPINEVEIYDNINSLIKRKPYY
jgi:hypothetical protein